MKPWATTLAIASILLTGACGGPAIRDVPLEVIGWDFLGRDLDIDCTKDRANDGGIEPWRFGPGWSRPAALGRWASGHSVEVRVKSLGGARRFWIECRPYHRLDGPQRVEITLNGQPIGSFSPRQGSFDLYGINLPHPLSEGSAVIGLHFDRTRSPRDAGLGNDRRPLALRVRRLALTVSRESPPENDEERPVEVDGNRFEIPAEGRLFINLWADDPVSRIRLSPRSDPGSLRSIGLRDPERWGDLDILEPPEEIAPDGVSTLEAGGIRGPMQLVIDTGPEGTTLSDIGAVGPKPSKRWMTTFWKRTKNRPNIVVFLLDAARADHCGKAYGYGRDTAPVLDRIAADALVFRKVFAQAPYTLCSVPTMFTGVGWGAHGVLTRRDRLSDEEITLAEALRDAGYRTIGLTASPNDSKRMAMDQGFDVFEQLWDDTDWATSIDPLYAAERVGPLLDDLPSDTPLFLMVHLVPPHAPYTPPDRYRLWSDPEYDGPCDGTEDYIRSVRSHRDRVSDSDLVHMISLYDANLRFSDEAVGRIIGMLDSAGRLEQTVVVITADHGEAFFEHGHLDHNSTIYDEMLHVPLVLDLPPGFDPSDFDPDRFAGLEDLTPTLLALAGVDVPPRTTGVDLLSDERRTGILLRTTVSQHILGFRTARWKLIDDRKGRPSELYDLVSDPLERNNVFDEHPGVVSFLTAQRKRAENLLPPRFGTDGVALSDEEKTMLRKLGYAE